ncbi:MAG: terminase gpA endonuclease subunit, partial [Gemmatimonadales bacterium]
GKEWPRLAREWRRIERDSTKRRAFVNTILAESWEERGEAPPWDDLALRREDFSRAVCPARVRLVTAGADLQLNRIELYIWGWGETAECWPLDHHIVLRDTPDYLVRVSALLDETYPHAGGGELGIERLAFDAGNETELVRGWQRRTPDRRVLLVKGSSNVRAPLIGRPPHGAKHPIVWEVGVSQAKHLLYDALRLTAPADGVSFPPGYVHLPRWWTEDMLQQLTAEVFDTTPDPRGFAKNRWTNPHQRRNEALDAWVYSRVAAAPYLERGRFPEASAPRPVSSHEPEPEQRRRGTWLSRREGRPWLG